MVIFHSYVSLPEGTYDLDVGVPPMTSETSVAAPPNHGSSRKAQAADVALWAAQEAMLEMDHIDDSQQYNMDKWIINHWINH